MKKNSQKISAKLIAAVAFCAMPFMAVKGQTAGTLDFNFGSSGKVIIDVLGYDNLGNAVALKNNGKIVIAGIYNNDFAIYQLNSDGTLDNNSFNNKGFSSFDFGGTTDDGADIAVQSDDKVVMVGSIVDNGISDFGIVRVNSDGTLDNTFGSSGKVIIDNSSRDDRAYALKIQSDGKIVVSGYTVSGGDADFMTIRLNTDGKLDNSFGSNGIKQIDIGSNDDKCYGNFIQPDGKILMGGIVNNGTIDFVVLRLNTDGTLDNTFGNSGKQITDFKGKDDWAFSIAMQSTGKILLGGYCKSANNNDYAIVRYDSSGNLDNTFGVGGIQVTTVGTSDDYGRGVCVQRNDKILFVGRYKDANGKLSAGLVRYNADGNLDNSFGQNGKFTQKFGSGGDDYLNAVGIQPDGRIFIVGFTNINGTFDLGVMGIYSGYNIGFSKIENSKGNYHIYSTSKNTIKLESAKALDFSLNKVQVSIYSFDGKLIPSSYIYNNNGYIIEIPEYYSNHLLLVQVNDNKSSQTFKVKL